MATPAILQETLSPEPAGSAKSSPQELFLPALLLAITFLSTTAVGMRYMANFRAGLPSLGSDADLFPYRWALHHLQLFPSGMPFSLALLAILLTHEFGHFLAARSAGMRSSPPFLLPAPSLSGTAGAIIRLRSRVPSRTALLRIGATGPLAGFAVAVCTSVAGLALSRPLPPHSPEGLVRFHLPLFLVLLRHLLPGQAGPVAPLLWHPVYTASWIGLLITSLNLVPAGQLDGGHILYALAPRAHRVVTWVVMAILVVLGVTVWIGWLVWVALLLLPGMRHPKVQDSGGLSRSAQLLAPACLLLFALCFTPRPFGASSVLHLLRHAH